jgi:hypothetical protein
MSRRFIPRQGPNQERVGRRSKEPRDLTGEEGWPGNERVEGGAERHVALEGVSEEAVVRGRSVSTSLRHRVSDNADRLGRLGLLIEAA